MKIIVHIPANSLSMTSTRVVISTTTAIGRPRAVGFSTITVGPTEPLSPRINDIWINTQ